MKTKTAEVANSHPIKVIVQTEFLRDQSEPAKNQYAFGYTITISNFGNLSARLLRRHWVITDSNGNVQEVYGEGVVGEQPLIHPGKSYSYSSGAILPTPVGTMEGTYTLINDLGDYFDAPISPFRLAMPELVH
jgi:ApaG protein